MTEPPLLSVEAARARILSGLHPTAPEIVPLADGWGRVLAAPLLARRTQPPTDQSAMDGYAVRAGDATAPLHLVGSAPAGHPWAGMLGEGESLRVFTGSVMPHGADTVVLQEDAEVRDGRVRATASVQAGRHIRLRGQDFVVGDALLAAGQRLGARDIGLAAAGDHAWLTVHRRPSVAILATGDEIAMPGERVPEGGVVSSNSHALAALVRAAGGVPVVLPVAGDTLEAIGDGAASAIGCDLLLTTGGASVGDHDLVRPALATRGLVLDFWKVAMRPGKPLMHGALGALPVIGLPGNPVSALVTALLFAWPAIQRLGGSGDHDVAVEQASLAGTLPANDHRADHLRAHVALDGGRLRVTAFARQDSAQLRTFTSAGALILRPPYAPAAGDGDAVRIIRLDRIGI